METVSVSEAVFCENRTADEKKNNIVINNFK
jgi:hypothetical protein